MRIITDSAAELLSEDIERFDIEVEPLIVHMDGKEVSASSINVDDFYDMLESVGENLPTTSQPSPGAFVTRYQSRPEQEILGVYISTGLSGTVQSATLAMRECPERTVGVIDTKAVAGAQRFQVLAAAMAAEKGLSTEQIRERLVQIHEQTELLFTVETLKYLAYGGRIGRVKALAGSLLNVKPVIRLDEDGVLATQGQAHSRKGARAAIVKELVKTFGADEPLWVTVLHGRWPEEAQLLAQELQKALNIERVDAIRISTILGIHTGPGVVGCGAVPMSLIRDLL